MPTSHKKRKAWQPLQPATAGDAELYARYDIRPPDRSYANDLYSVFVRDIGHGAMHLSFHRHNRAAVRDWRHFQAIKNEVAGPERLAVEVFPPESVLVDQSNEYHLWVFPPDWEEKFPFLLPISDGGVSSQEENELAYGRNKSRQRAWQPGIPTGRGRSDE